MMEVGGGLWGQSAWVGVADAGSTCWLGGPSQLFTLSVQSLLIHKTEMNNSTDGRIKKFKRIKTLTATSSLL